MSATRHAAFAGTWYPGKRDVLEATVDRYLDAAAAEDRDALEGSVPVGLVSPHAGLMYSGPVAAHGYAAVRDLPVDVVVLVGPSHHAAFDGVAVGTVPFASPLGLLPLETSIGSALRRSPHITGDATVHAREHSLEMQLPFLARVLPGRPIVPLLMGRQDRDLVLSLADQLARLLEGRAALLIASSDLSHFHDSQTASRLDSVVLDCLRRFDPEGLLTVLEHRPYHACGGGPMAAVMVAARHLGATGARVLSYADSGDVSGDKDRVVGYTSAVMTRPS
jgi:MEMO1 family protein